MSGLISVWCDFCESYHKDHRCPHPRSEDIMEWGYEYYGFDEGKNEEIQSLLDELLRARAWARLWKQAAKNERAGNKVVCDWSQIDTETAWSGCGCEVLHERGTKFPNYCDECGGIINEV